MRWSKKTYILFLCYIATTIGSIMYQDSQMAVTTCGRIG